MDESDIYDKIISAQEKFNAAITEVRKELAAENRVMRAELVAAFNRAHDENKERMEAIAQALRDHNSEDSKHYSEDERRFNVLNRIAFGIAGALALIMLSIQAWNAFIKP